MLCHIYRYLQKQPDATAVPDITHFLWVSTSHLLPGSQSSVSCPHCRAGFHPCTPQTLVSMTVSDTTSLVQVYIKTYDSMTCSLLLHKLLMPVYKWAFIHKWAYTQLEIGYVVKSDSTSLMKKSSSITHSIHNLEMWRKSPGSCCSDHMSWEVWGLSV